MALSFTINLPVLEMPPPLLLWDVLLLTVVPLAGEIERPSGAGVDLTATAPLAVGQGDEASVLALDGAANSLGLARIDMPGDEIERHIAFRAEIEERRQNRGIVIRVLSVAETAGRIHGRR